MSPDKHETLANGLVQMVDNPELSDVILVCEDGVQVHTCRRVLAARSRFFQQMFSNGMAESRQTCIVLPTVSSSVLVIILRFVYAEVLLDEDIQNKSGLDWKLLLKVVVAVRFFMINKLEKLIIERLWSDVPTMDYYTLTIHEIHVLRAHLKMQRNALACNFSILCEYSMLWNAKEVKLINAHFPLVDDVFCPPPVRAESIEVLCFHLMQILLFSELSAATLFKLSRKAFYLHRRRQRLSTKRSWSFEEYLRLHEVVRGVYCKFSRHRSDSQTASDLVPLTTKAVSISRRDEKVTPKAS